MSGTSTKEQQEQQAKLAELDEREAALAEREAELEQRRRELDSSAAPAPAPAGPDQGPATHVVVLADGSTAEAWNLNATHHSFPGENGKPGRLVRVTGGYAL